ncbi:MAG: DUF502 domain-containing protein [Cytophagales bacterium]|nr:DUF502 domain-containing protein [Cytophagales bacterium]
MKKFISYFLRGIFFTAPIIITMYILISAFNYLDSLIPINIPGIGILIIISAVTLLGYLGSLVFAKPIFTILETSLEKLPIFNYIYKSLKDVFSSFSGESKKFKQPVLVKLEKDIEVQRLGFVTETDLTSLGKPDMVAVYVPDSYAFSGNLFVVPKSSVEYLDIPVADAMKFIVSGGISGLPK